MLGLMEALAARLSHLDSQAEGAIRVVAFYDTLMRRRVDLPALARASAGLAECVAGIRLHGTGDAIRMSPHGGQVTAPPAPASTTLPVTLDGEEIGAAARYFGRFHPARKDRWVFGDRDSGAYLRKFSWTRIVRHVAAKDRSFPDDPALAGY
jgi:hypothetical protein